LQPLLEETVLERAFDECRVPAKESDETFPALFQSATTVSDPADRNAALDNG